MRTRILTSFQIKMFERGFSSGADFSPLKGIRILDLSRVLAGPFATMILGDLGAEVIKVERPRVGDDTSVVVIYWTCTNPESPIQDTWLNRPLTRLKFIKSKSWGPPFLTSGSGSDFSGRESTYFLSVNRNKKSICVDMTTEEGRNILTELAGVSDVLVENYIPGTLDKKGLGYTQLKETAPGLIYCSITGFGSSGPYKNRGGYDVIAASLGGLSHVTGEKDGGPMKVGVAMTDLATSLYAHGAILAALYQKEKTGLGQKIDCNLLSTQVSAMVNLAGTYLNTGQIPGRWGTAHASIVPYQTFKTADGYFTIGCGNNSQFREFSERIERTELPDHPAFKTNEDRVQNREKLVSILSERLGEYGNEHWKTQFEGSSFPYSPVNNLEQVFKNPQVQHNNLRQTVQHSTLGEIHQVGPAVQYSLAENRIRTAPPVLGEHTDAVLTDILGYSVQTIQSYREKGVIT